MYCLIVDANVAYKTLDLESTHEDYKKISHCLFDSYSPVRMAYGGLLRAELYKSGKEQVLLDLERAGKAKDFSSETLNNLAQTMEAEGLRSNDAHIIALARISGARLLCSEDKQLHRDFKNRLLLSKPPGKVYSLSGHEDLVRTGCPQRTRRQKKH